MSRVLLIRVNDLKELTPINGGVDKDKLVEYIYHKQSSDLRNYLGKDLLEKLITDTANSTISGDYLTLRDDYVKYYLANAAASEVIKYFGVQAGNAGATNVNLEGATNISGLELAQVCHNRAMHYGDLLIEYLQDNANSFAEYNTRNTTTKSNFYGWEFGGYSYDEC